MRRILSLLIIFSISSCIHDNKIPNGILSQDQMRKIMWDMMRADAYVADFVMKDSTWDKKTESIILYEKIFAIHAVTKETFQKSIVFYESRPDLLKTITDSLRSKEKKVMNYQNEKKPDIDTTLKKMKISKKLIDRKLKEAKQ
jgi:hypothetical protein